MGSKPVILVSTVCQSCVKSCFQSLNLHDATRVSAPRGPLSMHPLGGVRDAPLENLVHRSNTYVTPTTVQASILNEKRLEVSRS